MVSKAPPKKIIDGLRERVKKEAETWLKEHVSEETFIKQNSDTCASPLTPSGFLRARQIYEWEVRESVYSNNEDRNRASMRPQKPSSFHTKPLYEIIEENIKLVILGKPGLGKSTALRHLAFEYSSDTDKPLPVFIELKDYRKGHGLKAQIISQFKLSIKQLRS